MNRLNDCILTIEVILKDMKTKEKTGIIGSQAVEQFNDKLNGYEEVVDSCNARGKVCFFIQIFKEVRVFMRSKIRLTVDYWGQILAQMDELLEEVLIIKREAGIQCPRWP